MRKGNIPAACIMLLALAGCDTPLVTITPTRTVYADHGAADMQQQLPPGCMPGQPCVAPAPGYAYPPGYYTAPPERPDYHAVQDRNGRLVYCFKPNMPVQIEESGKKFLGLATVKYKIKCRHPRTGELTDAADNIMPLTPAVPPY